MVAVERPCFPVGGKEAGGKAAEKFRHGNVGFTVAPVAGGIEDNGRAVGKGPGVP